MTTACQTERTPRGQGLLSKRFMLPVLLLLLLLATIDFLTSTVGMGRYRPMDFHVLSNATRTWLHGADPYTASDTKRIWRESGGPAGAIDDQIVVYPPSAFPIMAPFAALPPGTSAWIWLGCLGLCVAAILKAVMELGMPERDPAKALLFCCLALLWWPLRACIIHGQPALPAVALCFTGLLLHTRGRQFLAGILIGLAGSLKPHLAAPVMAYLALRRQYYSVAVACGICVAMLGLGVVRMQAAGHDSWLADWRQNLYDAGHGGRTSDVAPANGSRSDIINLQVPLFSLSRSYGYADLGAAAICAASAVLLVWKIRRHAPGNEAIELMGLCILSMVPVYHRVPDLVLLLPLATMALSRGYDIVSRVALGIAIVPMLIASQKLGECAAKWCTPRSFQMLIDHFRSASVALVLVAVMVVAWRRGIREPGEDMGPREGRSDSLD